MVNNPICFVAAAFGAALLVVCCDQTEITSPVEFDVALDESNVYEVGEPINFKFTGNAENITFFSGEIGHQFCFRDRTSVPVEQIDSAKLVMNVLTQYSYNRAPGSALYLYSSGTYDGSVQGLNNLADTTLAGRKARYLDDSTYVRKMLQGGLKDWTPIDSIPNASFKNLPTRQMEWAEKPFNINTEQLDNFSFFIWFNPISRNHNIRKKCFMAGTLYIYIREAPVQKVNFRSMGWIPFMMSYNPKIEDPYAIRTWADYTGGFLYDFAQQSEIVFNGGCFSTSSGDIYECEIAAVTTPVALNGVNPDTGVAIKNIIEKVDRYSYVYNTPGTYKVAFEATNISYLGMSRVDKEIEFTIREKQ